jgi:hypothetical protein
MIMSESVEKCMLKYLQLTLQDHLNSPETECRRTEQNIRYDVQKPVIEPEPWCSKRVAESASFENVRGSCKESESRGKAAKQRYIESLRCRLLMMISSKEYLATSG